EITETALDGYTTTKTGDTGTIVKNETAEATFTNTYSVDSVIVDPPVKKDITGNQNLYNKGNFTFVIANTEAPDGVTAPMPTNTSIKNIDEYELENRPGYYEFGEIKFTAPGTYVYTVTESGSAIGVTNDSQATKTLTFVVTDNGKGALTVTPGTDSAVFTFTNVYKTGTLEISKKVVNEADPEDDTKFTFTVTFKDSTKAAVEGSFPYTIGETTGTISSGSTLQLGNGEKAVITDIPDGVTYEVTEAKVDGYTTTKTGDTGTISSETAGKAAFTNTYSADGETTITVTKELSGAAWPSDKTLTFTLAASNGGPLPEETTAIISAVGEVEFGPITFTTADAGKTYVYTISENGFGDGWTSSGTVTATVNVVDNGDGSLEATVEYTNNATIVNTYEASGTAEIQVTKTISGADWPSGKTLTFTLAGNNAPMPKTITGTLTAPGTVTFGPITYSESDAGKTYTYTISEDGFGSGWTSSGDVTATVEVTDNGNGTLKTKVTYSDDNNTITNTYKATGNIVLKASKELVGRDWKADETVEFTLLGPDGQEIDKKTIGSNGDITFKTINYTEADAGKTYEYTISETSELPGGVTKSADITATVTVTDKGDGTLETNAKYTADGKIINTYVAKPVKAQVNVSKKIDGYIAGEDANGNVVDRTFTFTMTGPKIKGELSISITTEGGVGGPKAFDEIEYTFDDMVDESGNHVTTKEFTYEVKETAGNDAGFTYDEKTYNVVVTVEDDLKGNLVVTDITKVDDKTNVNIVNKFVEESIDVQLHLTKVIEDQSNSAKDATFTFQLLDEEGNLIEEKTITTSGLTGSVDFTPITYNASGIYKYTLQEIAPVEKDNSASDNTGENAAQEPTTDATEPATTEEVAPAADNTEPTATEENAEPVADNTEPAATGENAPADASTDETENTDNAENAEQTESAEPAADNTEKAAEASDTSVAADSGSSSGWTYDTKAYPVTITVSDNFEKAKLEATVDIDGTETTELTVTNIYKAASTEATIEVYKEIDDKSGSAYETTFEFTLKDENGEVLGTASVEGPGKVSFDPIAYEKAGTYNYTIKETEGDAAGYTYDTTEYPVVVTVEDVEGKLVATVDYGQVDSTELTVTNIYDPEDATAELQARKVVEDESGSAPDETFTFELQDADGNVVETVSRKNGGYIYFTALTFDKVGTYEYTIKEVSGNTAGYTYDTEGRAVTITVTDDEKGNLVASVEYLTDEGEAVITNVYKAEPVTVNFDVEKVVEGASENAEPVDFTFTLIDSEGKTLENVTVSGSGTAEFSEIKYEKAGTYEYTITEKNDGAPGYTYDDAQYSVKVTVSDNNGKLAADVKITKDGEAADKVVFTNTYEADPTKVDFNAKKTLVGRTLKEGEFEFVLEIDGKVVETVKNTATGDITFATIEFDEEGSHTFKMYEVKGSLEGVTYDENVYEGTIVITDNGEGKLEAEVQGNTDIRFINNFKQTPPPPPITGEGNGLMIWLMIMAVALTGVAGLVVFARRRRKD
ncbi:MAG: hypothetical protein II749_02770, partial [Clostridia bacterium]|nr:hypothetical protein [Clostridia bacterium]